MKTFHEWLAMREGLWLNGKNAVIGLSRLNPLPEDSAVNKSLAKKPKPPPSGVPEFKPWKPAQGRDRGRVGAVAMAGCFLLFRAIANPLPMSEFLKLKKPSFCVIQNVTYKPFSAFSA